MKYVDIRDLPPCTRSSQCLRLLDDLDAQPTGRASGQLSSIEDLQEARQLRQIRAHISGCPTCSALLADARHMRTQQRLMLRRFLLTNEQQIPAATAKIFAALRHEQGEPARSLRASKSAQTTPILPQAALVTPLALHLRTTQQPRSLVQHVLTLATVVAVILAAVGLLNRVTNPSTASMQGPAHPQQPHAPGSGTGHWNSVIIGLTLVSTTGLVKSFTVYNFDTTSEQLGTMLTSEQEGADMHLEEISQDGQNLLYTVTSPDQQLTTYATYSPLAGPHPFYRLSTHLAGNALWMDANHVLTQNMQGTVLELDVHSNVVQQTWPLNAVHLAFYHAPFLYFTKAETGTSRALYRLNLTQPAMQPQQVTIPIPDTRFWLSPNGTTIFYARPDQAGQPGIYAINSDGTNERLLHNGPAIPIGYAEDDSLIALEQVGSKIQVIKLGATAQKQEQVILADAAPHATSLCGPAGEITIILLCDQNIALSPYGHGLLLHAYYANGSHNLVYDDLTNGTSHTIYSVPEHTTVQLPGWSRMANAA